MKRRLNIAKAYASTPSVQNLVRAAGAIIGEYDPENPYVSTGVAPVPGRKVSLGEVGFADQLEKAIDDYRSLRVLDPASIGYTPKILKATNSIGRGVVKGNEVTVNPSLLNDILNSGLSVRKVKPVQMNNPITNEAEAQAARDFFKRSKILKET